MNGAPKVHLIGFGSQGSAWAENLRSSGREVRAYLAAATGRSFERARALGFDVALTVDFPRHASSGDLVAMTCPDHLIGPIYREYLAAAKVELTIVLLHGYAVYAQDLTTLAPGHELALLAPKAIGPKLAAAFKAAFPQPHTLVAAFHASPERAPLVAALARDLGFAPTSLVPATFEQEAVGDLISEQALLCGGVFTLLEMTMENMAAAGVPDALIREECLTELELIAGLLRERGPASTLAAISPAAQCGTVVMAERLDSIGLRDVLKAQADQVTSREFVKTMRDDSWRKKVQSLQLRLADWERRLAKKELS